MAEELCDCLVPIRFCIYPSCVVNQENGDGPEDKFTICSCGYFIESCIFPDCMKEDDEQTKTRDI